MLTKDQSDPSPILSDFSVATELDPDWYQAWHTWALANFEAITQLEVSQQGLISAHFTTYIIPAVEGMSISMLAADDTGFLRSIALSPGNSLQDTLRLLTLWFTYGYQAGVSAAISQGIHTVSIDVWLEVIPQVRCLSLPISGRSHCSDHRSCPNSARHHTAAYRSITKRHRQGTPTSSHLPIDCCSEIQCCEPESCGREYHDKDAGTFCDNRRSGRLGFDLQKTLANRYLGLAGQYRAHSGSHPLA